MKPVFAAITILAAFLAVTLVAARHDARYSTALAVGDLSAGRLPGCFLASTPQSTGAATALRRRLSGTAADPLAELAVAEVLATDATRMDAPAADPRFDALVASYPSIPIVCYRSAAQLLNQVQMMSRRIAVSPGFTDESPVPGVSSVLITRAQEYLISAMKLDGENSVYYYEMAYSYLVSGDTTRAVLWLLEGQKASRFSPGDAEVLAVCQALADEVSLPPLEKALVLYGAGRAESKEIGLPARMETLVSNLLSQAEDAKDPDGKGHDRLMLAIEDLSDKLFQNARVLRQAQASLVADGLMWRQSARNAVRQGDDGLLSEARKRLAEASYKYILIGWQRAQVGLFPQQSIVEFDTPIEMRLDFSPLMQKAAIVLLLVTLALLAAAALVGAIAVKFVTLRQPALALVTLAAFTALAYGGCFLSLAAERNRVTDAVAARLTVALEMPEFLRQRGQPSNPAQYDTAIAREMLPCFDYTLQAARVLAHVGTRDCFDTLVEALDNPRIVSPAEIAVVLWEATGQDFGYRVNGQKSANFEAIKAWRQWWKANRDNFPEKPTAGELARAPEANSSSRTTGTL